MSYLKGFLLALSFVAIFIASGCGSSEKKLPSANEERLAAVKVVRIGKGDVISHISATGTLAPKQISRLGPKVEGKIERLYADEGDFVKKGAPLIKLEQDNFLIAERKAQASLGTTKAMLVKAEVNLENLTKEYKRQQKLYQQKITAEQQYDAITASYKSAQAEVKLAETQIKEAESNLSMAEQNLKDSIIYAPFSGFVVEKRMEEGEVSNVVTFQGHVLVLADISRVKIACPISEHEISFIKPGKKLEIQVDAFPGRQFVGNITNINAQVEEKSRTFIIKIEMPNKDFRLKSGMFARVKIPKQQRHSVLRVPLAALMAKGDDNLVFTVHNGLAKAQKITLGISDGILVEATTGLQEGDLVVIDGLFALKDGTKVEVSK